MYSADVRVQISNERQGKPSSPQPPSFLAWCHLSSLKGTDYHVILWRSPWDQRLTWLCLLNCWCSRPESSLIMCFSLVTRNNYLLSLFGQYIPGSWWSRAALTGPLPPAAIHQAETGVFSSLLVLQMPYIPGALREVRLLWFLIKPTI